MPNLSEQTPQLEPTGLLEAFQAPAPEPVPASAVTQPQTQEASAPATEAPANIVKPGPPPTSETARINKEIYERIMAARNAPPAVPPVQPPITRMMEQTKREMAEGARMNQHHESLKTGSIPRRPTPREVAAQGTTTPVFRPADWAPGMNSQTNDQRGVRNVG